MEDSLPALSLQINVPVLSLALTVVLMVAVLSLFLAFRRTPSAHFVKWHLCLFARLYNCPSNQKNVSSVSRWTIWTGLKEPLVSKHRCPETVNFPADSEFNGCVFFCSLSSGEPRHIIYEIQMRRPIQENVYTLD